MEARRVLSLEKLDLKSAYQMVPVHPDDRHLLGMKWWGKVLVDMALPLVSGLPQKCSMCWWIVSNGYFSTMVSSMSSIMDDFLFAGKLELGV